MAPGLLCALICGAAFVAAPQEVRDVEQPSASHPSTVVTEPWSLLGNSFPIFACCGLVRNSHLTAKIQFYAALPTSTKELRWVDFGLFSGDDFLSG